MKLEKFVFDVFQFAESFVLWECVRWVKRWTWEAFKYFLFPARTSSVLWKMRTLQLTTTRLRRGCRCTTSTDATWRLPGPSLTTRRRRLWSSRLSSPTLGRDWHISRGNTSDCQPISVMRSSVTDHNVIVNHDDPVISALLFDYWIKSPIMY